MEKIEDKVIARMVGHMAMPINVNDKLMVRMAPDNQTFNSKINSALYCLRSRPVSPNVVSLSVSHHVENRGIVTD